MAAAVVDELQEQAKALGLRYAQSLEWLAERLAQGAPRKGRQHSRHDVKKMAGALAASPSITVAGKVLKALLDRLGFESGISFRAVEDSDLPAVALVPDCGYRYIRARGDDGKWVVDGPSGVERSEAWPDGTLFVPVLARAVDSDSLSARSLFIEIVRRNTSWIAWAGFASLTASVLMLGTSLYSMQVYDRVIGSSAVSTLIVLTVGVGIAILVELLVKEARARVVDKAAAEVDRECAYGVFSKLLAVRIDQMPGTVGTLAGQVRSYESVRAFAMAFVLFVTTDGPFAFFFLIVAYLIGGGAVAAVPLIFLVITVCVGLLFKRRIERSAQRQSVSGNLRQGLLVEVISGAESIKATGMDWRLLGRWNTLSHQSMEESLEVKHLNDMSTHVLATLQQIAYVGLVAVGAWVAITSKDLTSGGIIACSILSGRILTPINAIPGLLVQWAHAKAALANLDRLFELQGDNHDVLHPLRPERLDGRIEMRDVQFAYTGQPFPMSVRHLRIEAGEKVALFGPIGSGKSTLLRLICGLVRPQRGAVLVNDLDTQHISAERRAELIGYLPQQVYLFGGTLRENLLAGLPNLSEAALLVGCEATGLKAFIASHPEGLDRRIEEGGGGLSGGQRQLIGITRLLLAKPQMWLLDEPTAAMDGATENQCLSALLSTIRPEQTLVLVTHKPKLLSLVQRIIVVTAEGVAMDGPRDQIIAQLQATIKKQHAQSADVADGPWPTGIPS